MVADALAQDGYVVFAKDDSVLRWAQAAHRIAQQVLQGPGDFRHGKTWFVGVDALPNASDGSIDGVSLSGAWLDHVTTPARWHQAQLSVVFPGYPMRDPEEGEAAHNYRRNRDAAHVDGLLPEGPDRQRHLREPHGFVAGLPLSHVSASPLVVWPGSHRVMQAAFARALGGVSPAEWGDVDMTGIYQTARRKVFAQCRRVPVPAKPGEVILLNRHLLHGVAPWGDDPATEGRMVAYFRPQVPVQSWL